MYLLKRHALRMEPLKKSAAAVCKNVCGKIGTDWRKYDMKEFAAGMADEQDHLDVVGGDQAKIARIVLEHLDEDPHYYSGMARAKKAGLIKAVQSATIQAGKSAALAKVDQEYIGWLEKQPEHTDQEMDAHIEFRGLRLNIETGRSRVRAWHDPHNGTSGMHLMRVPYGEIMGTLSPADSDPVDCFVGMDREAPNVFIITTMKPPLFKEVDEQKVMIGFPDAEEAERIFHASYDNPAFFGSMSAMPFEEFKAQVLSTEARPRLLDGTLIKSSGTYLKKSGEALCKQLGDSMGVDWKEIDLDAFCDGMFVEDGKHKNALAAAKAVIANLKKNSKHYEEAEKEVKTPVLLRRRT